MDNNEINEDEVFEKKESKIKPKLQKFFKNKNNIVILVVVLLIIIGAIVEFFTGAISNLFVKNAIGNSTGNITNCGYSVAKNGYIYYAAPSEDMNNINIYKVKSGTADYEKIYDGYSWKTKTFIYI